MRSRPAVCRAKRRFESEDEAIGAALAARISLRPYRCSVCGRYHLTSRTKGMKSLPSPMPPSPLDKRR